MAKSDKIANNILELIGKTPMVKLDKITTKYKGEYLAKLEGLLVGFSAGANVCAAYKIAKKLDSGIVVTILCDSGMKYLTTDLYEK